MGGRWDVKSDNKHFSCSLPKEQEGGLVGTAGKVSSSTSSTAFFHIQELIIRSIRKSSQAQSSSLHLNRHSLEKFF